MLAAHYRGILRAGVSRPELRQPLSLASAAYEGALKTLKKRFDLSPEAEARIQEAYAAEAVTVVKTAETAVEKRVQQALIVAQARGMHVRDGVKELRKAFKASGLTPQNSFTLEAIFRTQTQMAYSAGRWHANNHPAVQEILWGYEYVTVGDDRVRPEHVGLDGVTLPKEDPQWNVIFPPNGWACRCQAIEIFDEGEEIVRPPAMVEVDGKDVVPGADKGFAFNPGRLFGDPEPPVLRSVK